MAPGRAAGRGHSAYCSARPTTCRQYLVMSSGQKFLAYFPTPYTGSRTRVRCTYAMAVSDAHLRLRQALKAAAGMRRTLHTLALTIMYWISRRLRSVKLLLLCLRFQQLANKGDEARLLLAARH